MKLELEDQFILRLPQEQAQEVKRTLGKLKSKKKMRKLLKINLDRNHRDIRGGTVQVKGQTLQAKLVDLPCIIESYKTSDKTQLFKTADISQMLICQKEPFESHKENSNLYPHGITPPMKNVRKQRFRKVLKNKENLEEVAEVEKEILWLLRADNEAIWSKFEIYCEEQKLPINENALFGEISESSDDGQMDVCTFSAPVTDM